MTTANGSTEVRDLMVRWLGVAKCFSKPAGAIIAHSPECLTYKLLAGGMLPKKDECTCKARTVAEEMLALVGDTKNEIDRLDHADLPIYAAPCADCRCGSLTHWDDLRTAPMGTTAADWAVAADRDRLECQRCPCKGYRLKK
jgi:hypothetical protein